jgi:cell division protein FtsB
MVYNKYEAFTKKKKSRIRSLFSNQILISFLGLAIIIAISMPLAKNISKQYEINSEIGMLQNQISELDGKNANLKNLIGFLESDQFIDEEARKSLNFKKAGEEVVVIKGDATDVQNKDKQPNSVYMINQAKEDAKDMDTNPGKWLKYFFAGR